MPQFLLTLGRARSLALAESLHLLSWTTPARHLGWFDGVALLEAEAHPDLGSLAATAGGIVKAHTLVGRTSSDPNAIADLVARQPFFPERDDGQGKFTYGVSLEGFQTPWNERATLHRKVCQGIKVRLRERGIGSRFIGYNPKERSLSLMSIQVGENRLLDRGFEVVLIPVDSGILLAHTVAVQDYEAYGERDFERPERLTRSGLLPPKLARMMVNLARRPETRSVYDPFCGGGGVLMEALDLGLDARGSDLDEKAVAACRKNLEWYQKTARGAQGKWSAEVADARTLVSTVGPLSLEAVASESYLGPPLTRPLGDDQARQLRQELRALYLESLGEIRSACKPGARVVMALPRIATRGEELTFSFPRELDLMGYKRPETIPGMVNEPLLYGRPGQKVTREILVLEA